MIRIAIAPLGSCSGCDVAIADIGEDFADLAKIAEIVYWPTGADPKMEDLEALDYIDISITHGSIRTSEEEEILKMLRRKSKVLVAFGSCGCFGGIPGLVNLSPDREEVLRTAYESIGTDKGEWPRERSEVDGKELTLPALYNLGHSHGELVDVDYFVPGCPPVESQVRDLIDIAVRYANGEELPPKGTVLAGIRALCDECPREKPEKIVIDRFYRVYEKEADPNTCFLAQGIICMGPATRSGCGARCISANMPCRGCFGPPPGIKDQGAKMLSAIASLLAVDKEMELGEEGLRDLLDKIPDPAGTFYRFTLPSATINRRIDDE